MTSAEATYTDHEQPWDPLARALDAAVGDVRGDGRAVTETLSALEGAVERMTGSSDLMMHLGIMGLPLMGAAQAMKHLASEYVREQTGTTLGSWAEVLHGAIEQFEEYLDGLDAVLEVTATPAGAPTPEQLDALADAAWSTRAWRQVVERLARVGELPEAILRSSRQLDDEDAAEPDPAEPRSAGRSAWRGVLEQSSKQARSMLELLPVASASTELRRWVMRPFLEMHDQVRELPARLSTLSGEVAELELLIELALAHGRPGDTSRHDVEERIAVAVTLPDVLARRERAGDALDRVEGTIARLAEASRDGGVSDRARATLAAEYDVRRQECLARCRALDEEVEGWREAAPSLLRSCEERARRQLELVSARLVAEGPDGELRSREAVLERELVRLGSTAARLRA